MLQFSIFFIWSLQTIESTINSYASSSDDDYDNYHYSYDDERDSHRSYNNYYGYKSDEDNYYSNHAQSLAISTSDQLTLSGVIGGNDPLNKFEATTKSGNLLISKSIYVTSKSSDAIILNAGLNADAGTASGGDIKVPESPTSPTFTTGSGGRVTLFSGSISGTVISSSIAASGSG